MIFIFMYFCHINLYTPQVIDTDLLLSNHNITQVKIFPVGNQKVKKIIHTTNDAQSKEILKMQNK